ncbi:hypothetical protein LLG39_08240, partial [bacterium]|nr:hypothetical protein [bacterium]
ERVGDMEFGSHAILEYSEAFHNALGSAPESGRPPKIVIDYAFSRLSTVFTAMLGKLKWDTVSLNAYADVTRLIKDEQTERAVLDNLSRVVVTLNADAGVLMDPEGEKLLVVDNQGRVIDPNTLTAAFASLFASQSPNSVVAVPVTAPAAMEDIVEASGGSILRTKTDPRALMARAEDGDVQLACDCRGGFVCPEFHPSMDAMYAFVKLVHLLQKDGRSFAELVDSIPRFNLAAQDVPCPWEHKGKIMRVLAQEEGGPNADYTDGIKIINGQTWALVLPDSSEPCFHVYAEASNEDTASELVRTYTERVRKLAA